MAQSFKLTPRYWPILKTLPRDCSCAFGPEIFYHFKWLHMTPCMDITVNQFADV